MTTLTGSQAREYWKALMDNASQLVQDAHTLVEAGSPGRALSLMVLAQEELGKALWVYDVFCEAWNVGDDAERTVGRLTTDGRSHVKKYLEAMVFSDQLADFWGEYSDLEQEPVEPVNESPGSWSDEVARQAEHAEQAARTANLDKQRGFYVDLAQDGTVTSPGALEATGLDRDLQVAAQVIEMLLITDHSRMKHRAVTPYDSTHQQQGRLLPISHPTEWARASAETRRAATRPPGQT